ncbi:MAG: DUF4466 family protein [Tannerella sp.]|jgi:hypothetical protein|nr:DUF4466 family protein [Tannerella sp.]
MNRKRYNIPILLFAFTALLSCDDGITLIGDSVTKLSNDCIKRSLPVAPNIVGNNIEFAYAMALPSDLGKLQSAQVVASIPGGEGTRFDPNSYYTNNAGLDVPVPVASESVTNGATTSVTFTADTCASTLRYYYYIPEEARDREVSFTFSVKASNGQTAEYKMGPYKISKMDMTLNKVLSHGNACYISFHNDGEAVTVYTAADLAANSSLASQTDLVYTYNDNTDLTHGFFAANAPAELHPGVTFPSGFVSNTKIIKVYGLRDRQLSDLNSSLHVDDLDFQEISFNTYYSNALKLVTEGGLWIETADGQYRAFVFINATAANTATISVKRYKM